ncbi:MAG: hypothetical protein FJ196_00970 [Gammaproteobacteria bacterium]|nr:hypothetical protein [Gammaproteobacteria bacterium]
MLARVSTALGGSKNFNHIVIGTPEDFNGLPKGVGVFQEHGTGLNAAGYIIRKFLASRFEAMLVAAADALRVTFEELDQLIDRSASEQIVVAQDCRVLCTNALWLTLLSTLLPQHGERPSRRGAPSRVVSRLNRDCRTLSGRRCPRRSAR